MSARPQAPLLRRLASVDRALICWIGVAATIVALRLAAIGFAPALTRDSFQYLSVAAQFMQGHAGETPIVHYDAERTFGVVPAPMVTFPLGYAAAIAPVAALGIPLPYAALVVNCAALLACVVVLWWMSGRLGFTRTSRHVVLACVLINAMIARFATFAMTELLFTALVVGGLALLLRSRATVGVSWHSVAAGLALGLAYHVRYAGLFFLVGLAAVTARYVMAHRDQLKAHASALVVAAAIVSVGMLRNIVLVGRWHGRAPSEVSHEIGGVLFETARAGDMLVLGPGPDAGPVLLLPRMLFFGLALASVGVLLARRATGASEGSEPARTRIETGFLIDLMVFVAVYCACMFYAALTTNISYGARMFVPLVPLGALLVGALASVRTLPSPRNAVTGWMLRAATVIAGLLYATLNLGSIRHPIANTAAPVFAEMSATTRDGVPLREVVRRYAGRDGIIVANNGQAVGYVLGRRTVSLVGPRYSGVQWTEATVHDVIQRYAARLVVITMPNRLQPEDDDIIASPFVRKLARGDAPSWLRLTDRVGAILLYVPVPDSSATAEDRARLRREHGNRRHGVLHVHA